MQQSLCHAGSCSAALVLIRSLAEVVICSSGLSNFTILALSTFTDRVVEKDGVLPLPINSQEAFLSHLAQVCTS